MVTPPRFRFPDKGSNCPDRSMMNRETIGKEFGRMKHGSLLRGVCLLFLLLQGSAPLHAGTDAETKKEPFLGAWIHIHALFDKSAEIPDREASIAAAIEDCRRSGLKAVVPFALTSSGDSHYPSKIVPKSVYGDWDPLGVVVREARARDLEVHIAVPALVCGHDNPTGILEMHPEWALLGEDGARLGYISGGHPEARKWVVSVIQEIARNYQPDGIVLDYLRFPNKATDVDPETRARFLSESGKTEYNFADKGDAVWQTFKEAQLIQLAREIRTGLDEVDEKIETGLYTWGPHVAKNHNVAQNWVKMAEEGSLDVIHVSGYLYPSRYGDGYLTELEKKLKEALTLAPPEKTGVRYTFVLGVKTSHGEVSSAEQIHDYLRHAQAAGVDGVSVFTLTYLQPFLEDFLKIGPFGGAED